MAFTGSGVEAFTVLGAGTVTSGGTTAPSAGTSQSWTVTATVAFPVASTSATPPGFFYVADVAAPSELILITVAPGGTGSGQSWTAIRGADGTTPVTHSAGFSVVQVLGGQSLRALRTVDFLNVVTMFGADNTGANDCHAAFAAAFSAIPSSGGVIYLPAGTYKLASTWTMDLGDSQTLIIMGDGVETTTILYYGSGDAVRMYDGSGNADNVGSGIKDLGIDGTNSSSNSVGLHIGDLIYLQLDLRVTQFTGTGSAVGVKFDNAFVWTEQMTAHLRVSHCDTLVVFTVSTGTGSYGYGDIDITCFCDANQTAVSITGGADVYNGRLKMRGNFASSASSMTSSVMSLTSASTLQAEHLDIQVECDGGLAFTPQTIVEDGTSLFFDCYGIMSFDLGPSQFTAGSINNYNFAGIITGDGSSGTGPLNTSGSSAWLNQGKGDVIAIGSAVVGTTGTGVQNITGLTVFLPRGIFAIECEIFYTPTGVIGSTTLFGLGFTAFNSGTVTNYSLTGFTQEAGVAVTPPVTITSTSGTLATPTHTSGSGFMKMTGTVTCSQNNQLGGFQIQAYFQNSTSGDTVNIAANSKLRLTPIAQ